MAALLGREVLTKDYVTARIRIAIHPQEKRFEVANPAMRKDVAWIENVAEVFAPEASLTELTDTYAEENPSTDRTRVSRVLEKRRKIINDHVCVIELADNLDIKTVTEDQSVVRGTVKINHFPNQSPDNRLQETTFHRSGCRIVGREGVWHCR